MYQNDKIRKEARSFPLPLPINIIQEINVIVNKSSIKSRKPGSPFSHIINLRLKTVVCKIYLLVETMEGTIRFSLGIIMLL